MGKSDGNNEDRQSTETLIRDTEFMLPNTGRQIQATLQRASQAVWATSNMESLKSLGTEE